MNQTASFSAYNHVFSAEHIQHSNHNHNIWIFLTTQLIQSCFPKTQHIHYCQNKQSPTRTPEREEATISACDVWLCLGDSSTDFVTYMYVHVCWTICIVIHSFYGRVIILSNSLPASQATYMYMYMMLSPW